MTHRLHNDLGGVAGPKPGGNAAVAQVVLPKSVTDLGDACGAHEWLAKTLDPIASRDTTVGSGMVKYPRRCQFLGAVTLIHETSVLNNRVSQVRCDWNDSRLLSLGIVVAWSRHCVRDPIDIAAGSDVDHAIIEVEVFPAEK
ncbi:MAG: hypothetical protein V4529_07980 [Gemmatimonadota bacterium]